jgi:hypothetical protein
MAVGLGSLVLGAIVTIWFTMWQPVAIGFLVMIVCASLDSNNGHK